MPRNRLEGVYIPRTDIADWEVDIGGVAYRRSAPGPVASARIQLDSIGCLTAGSIALKKPGSIPRPFEQQVLISVESKTRGWIPICRACLPPANPDGPQEWTLTLQPGEVRDLDGYFDGKLIGHSKLSTEPLQYTDTNKTVVDRALKANPDASIGVDWNGTVILARPTDGSPVRVSKARFFDWKATAEVVLPYATESRWDGGKGWAKGEYLGIARPPCTPRKAIDAGEVTFRDDFSISGPPVVNQKEIILGGDEYSINDVSFTSVSAVTRQVTAGQYAAVTVFDLQSWFERSALAVADQSAIDKAEAAVATAQGAYDMALAALGANDPVTIKAADDLQTAQTVVRLSRRANQDAQSYYEPLSAALSYGFAAQIIPKNSGCTSSLTGIHMWVSTLPWDDLAVGMPLDPNASNPDPTRPLTGPIPGIEDQGIVHPFASPSTIDVVRASFWELSQVSEGKPWKPSDITIPESYFRTGLAAALAGIMDEKWRPQLPLDADNNPDPGDEKPPSTSWDGKWYFYVAAWWQRITPETPTGGEA